MFRKMFAGGGHLGFSSSVHSPIKNFVEGGGNRLRFVVLNPKSISNGLEVQC